MARVLKGSHSFTYTPRIHPLSEWTIAAFDFPAKAGTHLLTLEGWKAELALGGWLVTYWNRCPAPGVEPDTVTHLSTNQVTMPVSQCQCHNVAVTMSVLWCQCHHVSDTMSVTLCQCHNVSVTMSVLWCQCHHVSDTMSVTLCQCYNVSDTMSVSQCQCHNVSDPLVTHWSYLSTLETGHTKALYKFTFFTFYLY